jgi:2'-5' RNA ligase
MPRTFFALTLPRKLRARLVEEEERLAVSGQRVSWVESDNLHLTLRFVGEVLDRDLVEVMRAGERAFEGLRAINLVVVGLQGSPSMEDLRVIHCGVRGAEEADELRLRELRARLDQELSSCGWRPERGQWKPHITLGRVRKGEKQQVLAEKMGPAVRREFGHFVGREAGLFQSFEHPDGVTYTPLQHYVMR